MSYPIFFLVGLAVTVMLAVALAGPLSVLALIGFWIAHWFFLEWSLNSAPVSNMSDAELDRVLRDWTKPGISQYSSSNLWRVRKAGDLAKVDRAVARVVELYDEAIRRGEKRGAEVGHLRSERASLRAEVV